MARAAKKAAKKKAAKPAATTKQAEAKKEQAKESASMAMAGNMDTTKTVIRGAHNELLKLEAKAAEIREAMGSQRARVKGLGIKMADFNAARRIIMLEGDDQGLALDGFRLTFEALSPGENLDWLKTTGQDKKQTKPKAEKLAATNGGAKEPKAQLAGDAAPVKTTKPPQAIKGGTPLEQEEF